MEACVQTVALKIDSTSDSLDSGADAVEADMFSVELKICLITEKSREIQLMKVDNVISLSCLCSICSKRFTAPGSLKVHFKTHLKNDVSLSNPADCQSSAQFNGVEDPLDSKTGSMDRPVYSDHNHTGSNGDADREDSSNVSRLFDDSSFGAKRNADNLGITTDENIVRAVSDQCAIKCPDGRAISEATPLLQSKDGTEYDGDAIRDNPGSDTDGEGAKWAQNNDACANSSDEGLSNCSHSSHMSTAQVVECDDKANKDYGNGGIVTSIEYAVDCKTESGTAQCNINDNFNQEIISGKNKQSCKLRLRPVSDSIGLARKRRYKSKKSTREPYKKKGLVDCSYCGKTFSGQQKLVEHIHLHTGEKPYECSDCGNSYRRKSQLNVHSRLHRGEDLHNCQVCEKRFTTSAALKEHSVVHSTEKLHLCSMCGKQFRHQKDAAQHMKTHTGEKTHACGTCGKTYIRASSLKDHMLMHSGEKPHQCSVCGKMFTLLATMKDHARAHGETPYNCSTCGKCYKHRASLSHHVRVQHTCEPLDCNICGKSFKGPKSLKVHQRTHAEEKPHPCSVCGQQFCHKYQLENHSRRHTGEKPFMCPQCGQKFSSRRYLTRHVKHHHDKTVQHLSGGDNIPDLEQRRKETLQQNIETMGPMHHLGNIAGAAVYGPY